MININKITLCDVTLNNFLGLEYYETITTCSLNGFLVLTLCYENPCEELEIMKSYSDYREPLYFEVNCKTYFLKVMGSIEDSDLQISILLEEQ